LRGWRRSLMNVGTQSAIRKAMAGLRNARFDLSLDFQGLLKSAMVARLARIPRRIGFAREALREPASAFMLTERVAVDDGDHVIRKNLKLVEHLGCDVSGEYEFPITLSGEDERFAGEQIERFDGRFAILNPGGGWLTKLWGADGFGAIADRLWEAYAMRSVVTYGPAKRIWRNRWSIIRARTRRLRSPPRSNNSSRWRGARNSSSAETRGRCTSRRRRGRRSWPSSARPRRAVMGRSRRTTSSSNASTSIAE